MTDSSARVSEACASAAPVFAALGDAARLRILAKLCEAGPLSISRLTLGARISRQAVTKHLHSLSDAGLASSERVGRESLWRLDSVKLAEAQRYLSQISTQWDEALGRLAAFVEHDEV
jgi:DNA-binding transcriptional ArsR family regulator